MATIPDYTRRVKSSLDLDYAVNLWSAHSICSRRKLTMLFKERELSVNINHHFDSRVYAPKSPITGDVVVIPRKDLSFDSVRVSLIGMSRVVRQDGEITFKASHLFLDLEMPIADTTYPSPRIFRKGNTYKIPFHFVMPDCLPTAACTHEVTSEHVRINHVRIPSTMGSWGRDDMSPKMARVVYSIRAAVLASSGSGCLARDTMTDNKTINVLSLSREEPILSTPVCDIAQVLSASKAIRKGVLSFYKGKITATASQPGPLFLTSDGRGTDQVSLLVKLSAETAKSATVLSGCTLVSAKLLAETWCSEKPMKRLPKVGFGRGAYSTCVSLFSKSVFKTPWSFLDVRKEDPNPNDLYMSELRVPIQFECSNHILLPTFHSCLVSRTYKILLTLHIGKTSLKLIIPIWVANEHSDQQHGMQNMEIDTYQSVLPDYSEVDDSRAQNGRPSMVNPPDDPTLPSYTAEA